MASKNPKKLVLIDGNAIIHRAFHALPPLTNKKGELLNAVYGFTSMLLKVISELQPDYIIASFDLSGPTFRHEEYKEYKATRVKAPDELYAQIERVKEVVKTMNIPIYEKQGFEADDVIGTLVAKSENMNEDIENIVVTGDLDTLQLVSPKTKVYALRRGMSDTVIYDEAAVRERYGIDPDQMVDYKGLRGDPSDNIPGVKGVGEKTASELIKKYKSIEGVYAAIGEIKGALKEKLKRDKMQAFMSKRLSTIMREVPIKVNLEEAVTREFDRKKLVELFQELNFFSLIKRIPGQAGISTANYPAESGSTAPAPIKEVKDFKYERITEDKVDDFIKLLQEQKEISLYLRTSGPARNATHSVAGGDKYYNSELLGIGFSWKAGRAAYVAFSEIGNKSSQPKAGRPGAEKLKAILENESIKKIGYDLKYCIEVLRESKIELKGELFDTMLAAYVLNPGGKVEFKNLVMEELKEEIIGKDKSGQLGLGIESEEAVAQKICRAADYIWKLKQIYEKKILEVSAEQRSKDSRREDKNVETVFRNIEMPLVEILAGMEMSGIQLNPIIFKGISQTIDKRIENLEKSIYELADGQFNINSPKQVAEVLFEKLKLPTGNIKKTKTGFSTASGELAKLSKEHKIIEKIENYRELFKLKTTYLDTLPEYMDKKHRIHTNFNQAVTATGRLSSSDPNLQNIPIKTDLGQLIRTAFVAEDGWKFLSADYSQIDLRVVAHVSEDKKMIETFYKGEDIHRMTAAEINKVTLSQVTETMRKKAKALNFGVLYGMSVFGFSESAGVDREEAKRFINEYMEKFSGVASYMRETKESVKKNLYVETELGRRRYIPEINSPNFQVANAAERMAINMPIQGMTADIMKLAMIRINEFYIGNLGVRMILQIHDEIVFEVKEDIVEEVGKKVKEIMESVYELKVPLVAKIKIGDSWGEI